MRHVQTFSLQGTPLAKERARKGAGGKWYAPQSDIARSMEWVIKQQIPESFKMIPKGIPVIVNFSWFFEPAKAQRTKKFLDLIKNDNHPFLKTKGDIDNIFKFYTDIMSGIVYYDDNQIYKGQMEKYYSLNARTEIEVKW